MLLFIIGIITGIIGGMGIGGGTVLIPVLLFFTDVSQHTAQATNLAAFIPSAVAALYIHIKNKRVKLRLAMLLLAGGFAGALLGSMAAGSVQADVLGKIFGFFLLAMGIYELCRR